MAPVVGWLGAPPTGNGVDRGGRRRHGHTTGEDVTTGHGRVGPGKSRRDPAAEPGTGDPETTPIHIRSTMAELTTFHPCAGVSASNDTGRDTRLPG
ncbi:hypothetical protein LX16_2428 [Stackebrandtia albiflava]|uniref:Uncharacterized protein n=1 Tax=Stackebrandtia albiflava TaxID=406432 RepID=A0A562V1G9_9ACTN|nr:hypothetical protein LX16_2428 [Stackebrandtia albiflava]